MGTEGDLGHLVMEQKPRWQQRLEDFDNALERLKEALSVGNFNDLEKDGVIQRFEFTFELAWKTMKDFLEDQGFIDIASPKKVLQKAYAQNLFLEDTLWMQMLVDRNSVSHLYKQEMSNKVFENIKNKYAPALSNLARALHKEAL